MTHIQKESAGMNKLYAQSMCSVKQWRSYQAAEGLVSGEVDEVRAEADEIEPGWSQVSSQHYGGTAMDSCSMCDSVKCLHSNHFSFSNRSFGDRPCSIMEC